MSAVVRNMVADAIQQHKEVEEEEDQAQQLAEHQQRKASLPPPNCILGDPSDDMGEGGECEPLQAAETHWR
ncbi:hypothetical protein RSOLAG1IB_11207 [Rhizoctonia solani AG-1 IB]|uniref:Uncharacterized protein n=1 Tax=Thanatephorus cucumeris (strain AG1-IB / isolate 7/3/14) TaxID=1108050 RepID=A0A0B7F6D8_THACB|nr:hypothetical protein RSOLAG1IB_11207 [Rhizoctonia solani AG-1 IB]